MLWEIKNSEMAVGWPTGGDILEAIKPIMYGWFKRLKKFLTLISITLKYVVSVAERWSQRLRLTAMQSHMEMDALNLVKRKNSSLTEYQGQRKCMCVWGGCIHMLLCACFVFVFAL